MVGALEKYVNRLIRQHAFPSEHTYEHALYEHYSDNFKRLATAKIVKLDVEQLNSMVSASQFQFGALFTGYTNRSFIDALLDYHSHFVDFHNQESANEH